MKAMVFASCAALLFACQKKNEATTCLDATVVWMGSPAADGLGWILKTNNDTAASRFYVPVNLAAGYQKDGLPVRVCVEPTGEKVACFCAERPPAYRITFIQPR